MNVGIVGYGLMGRRRRVALEECGDTCVGIVDPGATGTFPHYDTIRELAEHADAIIVATPHAQLAPCALAAVQAGCKRVLVEKPAASSLASLEELNVAAHHCGARITAGYTLRYFPGIQDAVRAVLTHLRFGSILRISADWQHGGPVSEWHLIDGVLWDLGSHLLDLAILFGSRLDRFALGHDANRHYALCISDRMEIRVGWSACRPRFTFEIDCQHGGALVSGLDGPYGMHTLTLYGVRDTVSTTVYPDARRQALRSEWKDFRAQKSLPLTQAYDVLRILETLKGKCEP